MNRFDHIIKLLIKSDARIEKLQSEGYTIEELDHRQARENYINELKSILERSQSYMEYIKENDAVLDDEADGFLLDEIKDLLTD